MANMLKIAICDDEELMCNKLNGVLTEIENLNTLSFDIKIFLSGEEFENYIRENNQYFDVIFLDIEFPGKMNGIDIGSMIRKKCRNEFVKIIYVSNHTSYALDLFKIHTFDFVKKPFYYDNINQIIQDIIKENYKQKGTYKYKVNSHTHEIDLYKILYFKSDKRKIFIKTYKNNLDPNMFYGKISDISTELFKMDFFLINSYYLVNYYAVAEFDYLSIKLLNNEVLNISQPFRADVRDMNMKKMEENKNADFNF